MFAILSAAVFFFCRNVECERHTDCAKPQTIESNASKWIYLSASARINDWGCERFFFLCEPALDSKRFNIYLYIYRIYGELVSCYHIISAQNDSTERSTHTAVFRFYVSYIFESINRYEWSTYCKTHYTFVVNSRMKNWKDIDDGKVKPIQVNIFYSILWYI